MNTAYLKCYWNNSKCSETAKTDDETTLSNIFNCASDINKDLCLYLLDGCWWDESNRICRQAYSNCKYYTNTSCPPGPCKISNFECVHDCSSKTK